MQIVCKKIFSAATGEDLGDLSPWLKRGKTYIVLAMTCMEGSGIQIYIQTEHYNEPHFISARGFEFINQIIPASWIAVATQVDNKKVMTMLPASWNYEDFFNEVDDQKPKAIAIFNKEVEIIYRDEGLKS